MGVLVRQKVKGSGIWWVVVCHRKKRKYVRVGSKEAAKAAARKIEEALAEGKLDLNPEEPTVTLREYAEKLMAGHVAHNLKPSTQRAARGLLDNRLLPAFGDRPLKSITRAEIKALCFRALEEGRARPKKLPGGGVDKRLSAASAIHIARALSAIFNHAIEDGIVSENPAQRLGRFLKVGDRKDKINILTPPEGRRFLDAAKEHSPRYHPIFAAALFTGMRQGELIGLQWGDIDWNGNFIEVRRANWNGHVSTPKSGKGRRVDLSDTLARILADHRRAAAAEALKEGQPFSESEWVFTSVEGTALDAANLRKVFVKAMKKAGLRQIRFHDLRHTFASWLIGNGEPLAYVKEQLGHSSIQITVDTYGHLIPGANRQAVNRLAAMLENAPPARRSLKTAREGKSQLVGNISGSQEILMEPTGGIEPPTC